MNAYTNNYLKSQIETASKEQILLMLYDGAIRFSKKASQAIEADDTVNKGKYLGKTIAIITEFSNSLNHQVGGDISKNLDALYAYMIRELSRANIKNETAPIDSVGNMLSELRETWAAAITKNNKKQTEKQTITASKTQTSMV